ncbi:MAG: hypothetical protein HZB13_10705 [Acidobacteria bacterium]|nr:hypothetical protein [Acidobacteriota bacterium]
MLRSRRFAALAAFVALALAVIIPRLNAQYSKAEVITSKHNLSASGPGPVTSTNTNVCIFCHAPHNVYPDVKPLWNHTVSAATYNTYVSTTYGGGVQTPTAGVSKNCLSCHDGTIALGSTVAKGLIATTGSLSAGANLGTDLTNDHPLGFQAVDDGQLATTLFQATPASKDPTVKLPSGRTECTTCHDPHKQNIDTVQQDFLVRSNSSGAICLACHEPARVQPNWLNGWATSAHATATNTAPTNNPTQFALYGTVAANACGNCHREHGTAPAAAARLVRGAEEATCTPCHFAANLSPALTNLTTEFTKLSVHPATTVSGAHDAAESVTPLNGTRHSECPDCHNPHASRATGGATAPPGVQAPLLNVSGFDGAGVLRPALNEYQVCFKCHSTSTNKPQGPAYTNGGYRTIIRQSNNYNESARFNTSPSYHNVTKVRSAVTVPSLRGNMLTLSGAATTRTMGAGTYLYCTDCHSNNQNRNFGGTGPNGPHGSTYPHLLERRFEMEPLGGGGVPGTMTFGVTGTYAMCDKCHLVGTSTSQSSNPTNSILRSANTTTFRYHFLHVVSQRTSCTTCHDPHGAANGTVNNNWLINFDTSIVTPSGGILRWESTGTRTGRCYLTCHNQNHNPYNY